jgi:hypothetical protein
MREEKEGNGREGWNVARISRNISLDYKFCLQFKFSENVFNVLFESIYCRERLN